MKIDIFPTMITPYNADGSVDYETAKKYVKWYFDKGCTGIFAVCQSSEILWLSADERVELHRVVWQTAKALEKEHGRPFTVVSSGHVEDSIEEQAKTLCRIAEIGTDGLIWITNRLDPNNEGDDVWIENAQKLLALMPKDVPLGLYECPMPYKRLVNEKILDWCLKTGRFRYMKDTCCDTAEIARRVKQLQGSNFRLLNANCQTLLQSLQAGGHGYCGIMANFHPELYVWLAENFEKDPARAQKVQNLIGTVGYTENSMPYPLTAKYSMTLAGIPTQNIARNRRSEDLTDYMKESTRQMFDLCNDFYKENCQ